MRRVPPERPVLCLLLVALLFLFTACTPRSVPRTCAVVFEDHPEIRMEKQVFSVRQGSDLSLSLSIPEGTRIQNLSYPRWSLSARLGSANGFDRYTLTLHAVRYPALVRLTLERDLEIRYHVGDTIFSVTDTSPRLRPCTEMYDPAWDLRGLSGFVPIGWNTEPDGSGTLISFGSRVDRGEGTALDLYCQYAACTQADAFTFEAYTDGVVITDYHGSHRCDPSCPASELLVIPSVLGGLPVRSIRSGAFGPTEADRLVLPPTLRAIEDGAFASLQVRELVLFDSLETLSDQSFGAASIRTLRLQAATPRKWSGTYFDTLPDKMDRLRSLENARKLVLLCGSSARFGYNSALLDSAFPDLDVVNLGVYAYANLLPYARMAEIFCHDGDVLLLSPELDAIDCQFFGETRMESEWFAMTESDYDLLSLLNLSEFTGVFDSFAAYLKGRARMDAPQEDISPSQLDEDGNRTLTPSYNVYGDYVLQRENNLSRRLFGIKRAAYEPGAIRTVDLEGMQAVCERFLQRGVQVFFTYSPRSRESITEGSTEAAIQALDALLRSHLPVPVISDIHDSLMDPLYFYGTDNHLSTEGVSIHTAQVIRDLKKALEEVPDEALEEAEHD